MGETRAVITIRKDAATPTRRSARVRCVVDTGADHSVIPREILEQIGIAPHRRDEFVLSDGSCIQRDVGRCFVQFRERAEYTTVIFGEPGDATLLGVITLEILGLGVDPLGRELFPLELKM